MDGGGRLVHAPRHGGRAPCFAVWTLVAAALNAAKAGAGAGAPFRRHRPRATAARAKASAGRRAKARAAGPHAEAAVTHRRLQWCARLQQQPLKPRPGQSKTVCETTQEAFELRHLTAVEFLTKATLRRAADQSPSVRGRCKKKRPVVCLHGSLEGKYTDRRGGTMARVALATRTRRSASRVLHRAAEPLEGKRGLVLLPHPTLGRRIGEAAHPGPPSHQHDRNPNPARADRARAPEPHDEASRRRSRALHALAQMRLLPEHVAHDSGAETVSDTLSAHTAVASPRQSYSPEHVFVGAAAPTQPDEATPGFTPPHSPARQAAPSSWTAAPPPDTEPGPRNSWLFVPVIHAGAGLLSHAAQRTWSTARVGGARFDELAAALRESVPQQPALLLRTMRTLLASEARDDAFSAHNPGDLAMAAQLEALPAAPLPLPAAVSLCMGRDGYIPALAQSALLQTYGGSRRGHGSTVPCRRCPNLTASTRAPRSACSKPSQLPARCRRGSE